jgi:NAD(P)H-dependent FMN reductase
MKILAISGSLKATSSNTNILLHLQNTADSDIQFSIYEDLGAIPHFNPDLDTDSPPSEVTLFRDALKDADAVIFSTPEYAFGVPGVLKNAIDWTVSSGELVEKPVAVISASPTYAGGDKAHGALILTLAGALACKIPEECQMIIGSVKTKINHLGAITNQETIDKLRLLLEALERATKKKSS